ncbi:MAG TPA: hypothetical protein VGM54_09985 [Chthoniobacter sp.]|jgi:hypothetical protein
MANKIKDDHNGISIGANGTADKVGFHGATPSTQRSGAAQAAATQTSAGVVTTAPTNSSPYGYTQAQAASILTQLNAAVADVAALTALVNELRAAAVAKGLIKGSA